VSVGEVAVLGVGMHPWGKWGRNFVEYGVHAARAALADAGLRWTDIQLVSGADTIRNGYPGFVAGASIASALGFSGARVSSAYAACASGATAMDVARAQILAGIVDVALVVGADTTPKGFFAPVGGDRPDDPDWLRFRVLGATNPAYFALYARRRMDVFGATDADFAKVKVKNAQHGLHNPNARYRKEVTEEEVLGSPMVADPLRLLEICATSDGGAAVVLSSMDYARRHGMTDPVRVAAISTVTPRFPNTVIEMPTSPPTRRWPPPSRPWPSATRSRPPPTSRPGWGRRTWTWPRSTTSPRPSSSTGTRTSGCARRVRPSACSTTATPPSAAGSR
jgi:acetyl-CoA acetyltransferase